MHAVKDYKLSCALLTHIRLTQKIGNERGTLTERMKRSPGKRHTPHASLIETF